MAERNSSVTLVKCEECTSEISTKTGKCPHRGVPIEPNRGSAFKTFKITVVVVMAAIIMVVITAMLNHSVPRADGPRLTAAIQMADLNDGDRGIGILPDEPNTSERVESVNSAAQPQHTTHQVSAVIQDATKLDPTGLLFDLKSVLDQSPETVSQVLGESPVLWPDEGSISGTLRGKYKGGKIEIGYAGEGARFITIFFSRCKTWKPTGSTSGRCIKSDDFTNYRYQQDIPGLLQALGLPKEQRPSLNTVAVLRWNEASGIHQVSVFPNGLGGINYIHVISSRHYACLLERTELECKSY